MAKDRRVLQHIHSSIPDKQPTPASLRVGEIAVNNAENKEFISLKNSADKVVRFSSDEQLITWMEKKEVMPYEGQVRGAVGPTGTKDDKGSYGITNDDLLQNKSNIIIKLNQVAASSTTKHDVVNGAVDIYDKEVNPTSDSGKTDNAGFAIDMSRYAMQGANPEFSGTTNTCYTNLNGTTKIKGVDGACGSLLEITVNSAKTDIETANTEITSATTVIGTNATTISGNTTLNVSGTTTETKVGNVIENHSGTTTDNNNGNVIVNNQANFNMNTSSNTTIITTGDTVIHSDGAVGITAVENIVATSSESSIIITANDDLCATAGDVAAIKGVNKTNVGIDCLDDGRTMITNVYGDTINERANTADTRVISAYTSATTATTVIDTANTSATTATLSGTNFTLNETNTTINSCGKVEITTDSYSLKQCSTSGGSAEFEFCNGYTVKSNKISLQQCDSDGTISISAQTQNINGGNLTINESGDVEVFANDALNETGGTVNITSTNNTNISANDFCVKGSTSASIGAPTTNIGKACDNSTATTINISGTTINEGGTTNNNNFTTINNTATTINNKANFNITGATYISGNVTIGDDLTIPIPCDSITSTTVNNALCEIFSKGAVTIEKNTSPTDPQLATIYKFYQNGEQITNSEGTPVQIEVAKDQFLQNAEVVKNTSGEWVIRLTWWIYDPDSGTHTTTTTDVNASELVKDLTAVNPGDNGTAANHNVKLSSWYDSESGDMKFSAETTPTMHVTNLYATTNISGTNITASDAIRANNVSANTISAATSVTTKDLTATSNETVGGTLNVSGASTINGVLTIPSGISKKLTWASGTFTADTTGYNGSADKVITVPTSTAHLTKSTLTISYGNIYTGTKETSYNTEAAKTITIPDSLSNVSNGNAVDSSPTNTSGKITIKKNLEVSGTVTATGAIYSSDRNLKENISFVKSDDRNKVGNVFFRSFNFKDDDTKRKTYGVIAQEVQEAGLDELVHVKDDGMLGVDYTSLFALKCAYLENFCGMLNERITQLEEKVRQLEENKK